MLEPVTSNAVQFGNVIFKLIDFLLKPFNFPIIPQKNIPNVKIAFFILEVELEIVFKLYVAHLLYKLLS
jgi:hypothetical protein